MTFMTIIKCCQRQYPLLSLAYPFLFLRDPVDLNHVLRIFSPAHTPCLPESRLQGAWFSGYKLKVCRCCGLLHAPLFVGGTGLEPVTWRPIHYIKLLNELYTKSCCKNHVLPLNYPPKFRHTFDLSAIVAGLISLPVWTPLYLYGGTETITTMFWLTPCGTAVSSPCSLRLVTGVSLDTCAVLGVRTLFVISWTPCISGLRRTQRSFIYVSRTKGGVYSPDLPCGGISLTHEDSNLNSRNQNPVSCH